MNLLFFLCTLMGSRRRCFLYASVKEHFLCFCEGNSEREKGKKTLLMPLFTVASDVVRVVVFRRLET